MKWNGGNIEKAKKQNNMRGVNSRYAAIERYCIEKLAREERIKSPSSRQELQSRAV